MTINQAHNPLFISIANSIAALYTANRIPLYTDALVVFTCGAENCGSQTARDQLLHYAEKYFKHGSFFRAEDVFPMLVRSLRDDYLSIEEKLADYSDCVVIINESAGTLAELGAFTSNEKVVRKLLVVNPKQHAGINSFINLGPIAKADRKSLFKPTIHADMPSISIHFDTIIKRIEDTARRRHRLFVDFTKPESWKTSKGKHRLLLLQDILNLISPATALELETVMKRLFPKKYVRFRIELGLLKATRYIFEESDLIVASPLCVNHRYDVPHRTWLGLRKRILDAYRKFDPIRLSLLFERSAGIS